MIDTPRPAGGLEAQDRDQLLKTVRLLLAEANALSSRIAAVNEIGIAVNRTLDLNEILRVVARQAKWLLDFEHCSVCLKTNGIWEVRTLFGGAEPFVEDITETDNVGQAIRFRQPQIMRQGTKSSFLARFGSQLIIPLQADNDVLGTVNFAMVRTDAYTTDDMRIGYMLALQLSAAIRNAHNFQELTRTRDELHERAAELEARNQELDAYSHTIAHDLKTPLSSISLRSEIIMHRFGEALPVEVSDMFKGIQTSSRQMNTMIEQLLMLARLRRVDEVMVDVDATALTYNALLRFMHLFESNRITPEIMPDMPHALGHPQLVEEVLANLISNAVKYMGSGDTRFIRVRGELRGDVVRYEVEDTGVGITPEDQKRLFQMFSRLNTVSAEGLGLGLSIVHRIVTRLGGAVGVISTPGVGSTFWFELPAYKLAKTSAELSVIGDSAVESIKGSTESLPNATIETPSQPVAAASVDASSESVAQGVTMQNLSIVDAINPGADTKPTVEQNVAG